MNSKSTFSKGGWVTRAWGLRFHENVRQEKCVYQSDSVVVLQFGQIELQLDDGWKEGQRIKFRGSIHSTYVWVKLWRGLHSGSTAKRLHVDSEGIGELAWSDAAYGKQNSNEKAWVNETKSLRVFSVWMFGWPSVASFSELSEALEGRDRNDARILRRDRPPRLDS